MANQQRKELSILISWIIQISLQGRDSNLYMRHRATTSGRSFWKAVNRERERGRGKKSSHGNRRIEQEQEANTNKEL